MNTSNDYVSTIIIEGIYSVDLFYSRLGGTPSD